MFREIYIDKKDKSKDTEIIYLFYLTYDLFLLVQIPIYCCEKWKWVGAGRRNGCSRLCLKLCKHKFLLYEGVLNYVPKMALRLTTRTIPLGSICN